MEKIVSVSVIIPFYNDASTIVRAIDSVRIQKNVIVEIIVVNDCSPQKIPLSVLESDDVIVIDHKKNQGGAVARNTGVKKSSYDIIALLDADDEMMQDKLEKQTKKLFESGTECNICLGVDSKNKAIGYQSSLKDLFENLLMATDDIGASSSIVVTKKAYLNINGFDPCLSRHQDIDFILTYLNNGLNISLTAKSLFKKYHSGSPDYLSVKSGIFLFLKKWIDDSNNSSLLFSRKYFRLAQNSAKHFLILEFMANTLLTIGYRLKSYFK